MQNSWEGPFLKLGSSCHGHVALRGRWPKRKQGALGASWCRLGAQGPGEARGRGHRNALKLRPEPARLCGLGHEASLCCKEKGCVQLRALPLPPPGGRLHQKKVFQPLANNKHASFVRCSRLLISLTA